MTQRKKQLQTILTQSLIQAKDALLSSLKESGADCEKELINKLQSDPNIDWVGSAQAVLGHTYAESISDIERFEAALCQLELGLYGLCSDCEEPIEQARLIEDLSEQRCARCAKELHQNTA